MEMEDVSMVGGVNRFEIGFRDKFEFFELRNVDERMINEYRAAGEREQNYSEETCHSVTVCTTNLT
jgi:hypothetical protein